MPTIASPTFVPRSEDPPRFVLPPGEGIRLLRMVEYESFVDVLGEHLFGLVVVASVDADTKARLRRLLLAVPDAHLVVVLPDGRSSRELDLMAGPRLAVVRDATDSRRLVRALRRAWFEGRVERVSSDARDGLLPASLQCAISKLLQQRVTMKDPEPGEVSLCTTLIDLSERCGVSTDTLQRGCRRYALDLRAMMQEWRVALALREYFIECDLPPRDMWGAVGRRCGYEGESGIRGLILRVLDVGLADLTLGHLAELLTRLHSRVVEASAR